MEQIRVAAEQVGAIVSTIDGLSFQVNLLALNAAIEAAHAGKQGKGFAVIATEVRQLAQLSAAASREIRALVETSLARVQRGSALVKRSGDTLRGLAESVGNVTEMVTLVVDAAREQASGIEQVSQ